MGVSNGKLHYCLKALFDKGFVKLTNFANSSHRFRYAYLLTPAGVVEKAGLTSRFLKRSWRSTSLSVRRLEHCKPTRRGAIHPHYRMAGAEEA